MRKRFHIFVNNQIEEEQRGQAGNADELLKILTRKEIKSIFEHEAYHTIKEFFQSLDKYPQEDSQFIDIKGISCNMISNGHEITTLVFIF